MKCVLCNRPLLAAAASIPTRSGPISYGPKCARKAGLLTALVRGHQTPKKNAPRPGKRPAIGIAVADKHTSDLFQEELTL